MKMSYLNITVAFFIIILNVINYSNCLNNIKLHLEMYEFSNIYGVKADRRCCFDDSLTSSSSSASTSMSNNKCIRKCSTFFRFCLKLNNENFKTSSCISEFETQVIGQNEINKEQFNQTTDLIEFPITNEQFKSNQLVLIIDVYNDKSLFGNKQVQSQKLTHERELISKWILNLNNTNTLIVNNQQQKISLFNYKNQVLNQQLVFSYKFECSSGYYGNDCLLPICSSGCDLQKGGYCVKPNECICKPGWTGDYCNLPIENNNNVELCTLNCQNGAKCEFNTENKQQLCVECDKKLFSGDLCEIVLVKTCNSSNPCLNGGTCMNEEICICAPGYNGDRCQVKALPNQCGSNKYCYNDAVCIINNENNYECKCKPYFTGTQCETSLNLCLLNNPCKNGASCVWNQVESNYKCECADGYTGITCSEKIENVKTSIFSSMVGRLIETSEMPPLKSVNTQSVVTSSSSLTVNEIIIILTLGITLPILTILILLLVLRVYANRRINQKLRQLQGLNIIDAPSTPAESPSTPAIMAANSGKPAMTISHISIEDEKQQIEYEPERKQKTCQDNKHTDDTVVTASTSTASLNTDNFIQNNIFDNKVHLKEKVVCINSIQQSIMQQQSNRITSSSYKQKDSYHNIMASIV